RDSFYRLDIFNWQIIAGESKEEANGQQTGGVIPVIKRMPSNDAKTVGTGQTSRIELWFVRIDVVRSRKRRCQPCFIARSRQAAVFGETLGVQQDERTPADPSRLLHLASARNAARCFAMNSRPFASCSSTSGSYGVSR